MTTPMRILQLIRHAPATTISICAAIRVPQLTIRAMLQQHLAAGRVALFGDPKADLAIWSITPAGIAALSS